MSPALRLSACVFTFALVACSPSAPPASAPADAPAATTADAPPAAVAATPAPTVATDAPLTLTMDKVEAYARALKNLAQAAKADPGMGDPAINISEEDTAQYAARLDASPKMRAAITDAGLSTGEFAHLGETLLSAMMAQGALDAGQLETLPEGIDPKSVEFVRQHQAEIRALMGAEA